MVKFLIAALAALFIGAAPVAAMGLQWGYNGIAMELARGGGGGGHGGGDHGGGGGADGGEGPGDPGPGDPGGGSGAGDPGPGDGGSDDAASDPDAEGSGDEHRDPRNDTWKCAPVGSLFGVVFEACE